MEDYLEELRKHQRQNHTQSVKSQPNQPQSDNEENQIIIEQNEDQTELMPEFRLKADEAQKILEKVKGNNERVVELKQQYASATTTQAERNISQHLERIMKENARENERLKQMMELIAEDVEVAKRDEPDEPETRMKVDMQTAITFKVQAVLTETQESQMEFRAGLKNKITRQAGCLDSSLNDKQIQEICDDPNKMQELVQQKIYGQASIQLQNAVSDIQDKYQDILKLERSVQQVCQLLTDMALLVKNQGEIIDNIELNMNKAKDYVAKGEKQLIKAKKDHQAARKKKCCIIIIGLVLILIIVLPVLGTSL